MTSNSLLIVFEIVALAALSVVCIYLISVLVRVRGILAIVEEDLRELSAKAIPVLENLETITEKIKNVTENIDEQVESVKESIQAVKRIADNIVDFERKVQDRIEEPVMETVGTIAAVIKGVRTFVARLRA
ncbi:MAG TPA: DUF948 domain-containing protein [Bacteroidota bacterium]|nr:DUF948 domain-containing protein [Bacteroidota bacterium]